MPTMIATARVISHWPALRLAAAMVGYGNVPSGDVADLAVGAGLGGLSGYMNWDVP